MIRLPVFALLCLLLSLTAWPAVAAAQSDLGAAVAATESARVRLQQAEQILIRTAQEEDRLEQQRHRASAYLTRQRARLRDLRDQYQALVNSAAESAQTERSRVGEFIRQFTRNVDDARAAEQAAMDAERRQQVREAQAQKELQQAQDHLAQAITAQTAAREALAQAHSADHPPYLKEVRVSRGTSGLYLGRWQPKANDLSERIELQRAILEHFPEMLSQRQRELQTAIDDTRAAVAATDKAMEAYLKAVADDVDVRITSDIASSVGAIGQDALLGGGHLGAAIAALDELYKLSRPGGTYDQISGYWDLERLPGLSHGQAIRDANTQALDEVAMSRESILRAESVLEGNSTDTRLVANEVAAVTDPGGDLIQALSATLLADLRKLVANEGASRLIDHIRATTPEQVEARKETVKVKIAQIAAGLVLDVATTTGKEAARTRSTDARIAAYRAYLECWMHQVILENEAIRASWNYWAMRQGQLDTLVEIDALIARRARSGADEQMPDVSSLPLKEGLEYTLRLTFSKAVTVSSVTIDDRAVAVTGTGADWQGSFSAGGMHTRAPLVVEAIDIAGYRLHSPYRFPRWSERLERYDYVARPDHYHAFTIESAAQERTEDSRTGISVGVADVFGESGLRVQPAPGVEVIVLDRQGHTVASTLMQQSFNSSFVELSPGEYRLRLDIGEYQPALPGHCTDGYVRDFELSERQHLTFAASVYSATMAGGTGTAISTNSGDCITLKP